MELEDLAKLAVVREPCLSPDGKLVAFTVQHWDLEGDRYRSEIWLGRFGKPETARPVTSGRFRDHSPALSPDGRYLVFVSDRRPGKSGPEERGVGDTVDRDLWLLDLSGGEAVRLTRVPGSCSHPRWSPDGSRLAFLFQPRDPRPPAVGERIRHVLEAAGERLPEGLKAGEPPAEKNGKKSKPPIVRRITRLHWREDGKGFLPERRTQLWTVDVSELTRGASHEMDAASLGDTRLRRLTAGPYDFSWPSFSPDGAWLAVVANRSPEPDHTSGLIDLWLVPAHSGAAGGGQPVHSALDDEAEGIVAPLLVPTPAGPLAAPSWSPDGKRLAYLGHTNPLDMWGITNHHLWTVPVPAAAGGEEGAGEDAARDLIPGFDRTTESVVVSDLGEFSPHSPPVWRAESDELLFLVTDGGSVGIHAVAAGGGETRAVVAGEQAVGDLVGDASGRHLAFVTTNMLEAPEIFTLAGDGPPVRQSRVSADWRDTLELVEPEFLRVPVPDEGHEIEAWLLKPPDFVPGGHYPLILQIHGGPAAAYGHALYFELQLLAAKGYCVLFANPRGSQGYGFDFGSAIRMDLAAPAHRDLMAVVDEITKRDFIDGNRLAVTGGSWGGYMTNWILTQTDRFRTAITQRSICDFESDFGTSDFGYDAEWMLGGPPWTHREVYARCSPLTHVENIKTPLLILHSEEDWRCPPLQGEMLFQALKMLRRDVEMVRFPGEPHGLSRSGTPSRRLARLQVMLDWFDQRLMAAGDAGETRAAPSSSR